MAELVLRDDDEGVSTLTLNRPEALNALNPAMFVELRDHVDALAAQGEEVGAVVLRGAGRSFSAGNDLKAITSGERAPSKFFQAETLEAIEALPQAVIVSVRGHCYTGALELALAGDLLICSGHGSLRDTHGKWAMVPTWGMTQRLPRRIGPVQAKDLMFTGRVVEGPEAVSLGLANRCVPDDDLEAEAAAYAAQIAANSWHTISNEKRLMSEGAALEPAAAIRHERENGPGAGPDMADRIAAGFAKT